MDKIYVPDYIPLDYKYAVFDDVGIHLYQQEYYNEPGYYKVYTLYTNNQNKVITDVYSITLQEGQDYEVNLAHEVEVSHKWYDRPDALTILTFFCCLAVATIFVMNIFTSIFKKGGLLGGLL